MEGPLAQRVAQVRPEASASRPRRAMTLPELLVAIGVVGAVLAIALPAVSAVRASARTAACASNLRQLGIQFESARSRPGAPLPYFLPGVPASPPTGRGTIADVFPPHAYAQVLFCPSDHRARLTEPDRPESSYRYFPGERMYRAANAGDRNPARTVTAWYGRLTAFGVLGDDEPRHADKSNILWSPDGHVALGDAD